MNRLTLYQRLKPKYKKTLLDNKAEYNAPVKNIIAKLESTTMWNDLTISEIGTLDTFADLGSFKWGSWSWKYGEGILIEEENSTT